MRLFAPNINQHLKLRKFAALGIAGIAFVSACVVVIKYSVKTLFGKQLYESRETNAGGIEFRIRAWQEPGYSAHAPGGVYEYECRIPPAKRWSPITRFRYAAPEPIPQSQIRAIDSQRVYFFHKFIFGITEDGGNSWAVRGEPELSFDTRYQWQFPQIDHVDIRADGSGTMWVSLWPWMKLTQTNLVTHDWGKTWRGSTETANPLKQTP